MKKVGRKYACCLLLLTLAISSASAQFASEGETADQGKPDAAGAETIQPDSAPDADAADAESAPIEYAAPSLNELPSERTGFLLFGLLFGNGVQTDPNGSSGQIASTPRFAGSVDLLKNWSHSTTAFDYTGGGVFYTYGAQQIQQFTVAQRFQMGKRRLTLSDSLGHSYGGNFGSFAAGGGGLNNLLSGSNATNGTIDPGSSVFSGATNFSAIAAGPYLSNVARAVLMDPLSRRATATISGFYGTTSYTGGGVSSAGVRQFSISTSLSYQLSARSAIGISYGFRDLGYPHSATGNVYDHLTSLSFQRLLSSKTTLQIGAGPELTSFTTSLQIPIVSPPIFVITKTSQVNASYFASLLHSWGRTSLDMSYERLVTNGSGVVSAGANSDVAHISASRRVFKYWATNLDAGYARLRQIGPASSATGYHYWYAGAAGRRSFGHNLSVFTSYQYNRENASNPVCFLRKACSYAPNIVLVGISWHARPIRLDHAGEGDVSGDGSVTPESDQPSAGESETGQPETDQANEP